MAVTVETAKVYRGGGRRWFTPGAAINAEVKARIKRKHPSIRFDRETGEQFYWRDLPRSDVLYRRMYRLIERAFATTKGKPA